MYCFYHSINLIGPLVVLDPSLEIELSLSLGLLLVLGRRMLQRKNVHLHQRVVVADALNEDHLLFFQGWTEWTHLGSVGGGDREKYGSNKVGRGNGGEKHGSKMWVVVMVEKNMDRTPEPPFCLLPSAYFNQSIW